MTDAIDPVDHAFFLARADRTRAVGFFNDALFTTRHFPDSILTIGRKSKFRVAADRTLTKTEVGEVERTMASTRSILTRWAIADFDSELTKMLRVPRPARA